MQTLSSPRLRRMYSDKGAENDLGLPYALEIQRLQTTRGVPTYADALKLEQRTGLKAGVAPISEKTNFDAWHKSLHSATIEDLHPYVYPNGNEQDPVSTLMGTDGSNIDSTPYNNLWYQYASPVEENWGKNKNTYC